MIQVQAETIGEVDRDGYLVQLDDGQSRPLPSRGQIDFDDVASGDHVLTISGLATNCRVAASSLAVSVEPGRRTVVGFEVDCTLAGTLRVEASSAGPDLDPEGYTLVLDGELQTSVLPANGTLTVEGVSAREHDLELVNVAGNCTVGGENPRSVAVPVDEVAQVTFELTCAPASGELLAFGSRRGPFGDYDIVVMTAEGTHIRNVTNSAGDDNFPAWSPDGSRIAFESGRDGNSEVYVVNADGSGLRNVTRHPGGDHQPEWSPDGRRLAFLSNRDGNAEVYVVNVDGTGPVNLSRHPGFDSFPDWSPDGSRIAFSTNRDGDPEVYVMDANGGGVRRFTQNPAWDDRPAWSPDGSMIAFESNRDGTFHLFVTGQDGSGTRQLTSGTDANATWSPDGSRLAFISSPSGAGAPADFEIHVMNRDGSGIRRLTFDGIPDQGVDWSPR